MQLWLNKITADFVWLNETDTQAEKKVYADSTKHLILLFLLFGDPTDSVQYIIF